MPDTNYIVRRTTARTWALVAVKGGKQTLVDESKAIGSRRATIDFERKHRIAVTETEGDPPVIPWTDPRCYGEAT